MQFYYSDCCVFYLQLETFKRQLMQSLNDDNSSVRISYVPISIYLFVCYMTFVCTFCCKLLICYRFLDLWLQAETVDIGTCDQPVPRAYPDKGTINLGLKYFLIQYDLYYEPIMIIDSVFLFKEFNFVFPLVFAFSWSFNQFPYLC